jgi:hypothetical protein
LSPKAFCTFENPDRIDFAQYWYHENPIPKLFVSTDYYPPHVVHSAYMIFVASFSYLLSIILAKKTVSELTKKSSKMPPKTKALQDQLSRYFSYIFTTNRFFRTLFAMSMCPLCKFLMAGKHY